MTPAHLRSLAGPFCVICNRPDHVCEHAFVDQCDRLKDALRQAADEIERLQKERNKYWERLASNGMLADDEYPS